MGSSKINCVHLKKTTPMNHFGVNDETGQVAVLCMNCYQKVFEKRKEIFISKQGILDLFQRLRCPEYIKEVRT